MNRHAREDDYIDLSGIFFRLWKKRRHILAAAAAGFLFGVLLYALGSLQNGYVIETSFAVTAQNSGGTFGNSSQDSPNYNDLQQSQSMSDAVVFIASSNAVLDQVRENLHLTGTGNEAIRGALSALRYEETQIIRLTLRWADEDEGKRILAEMDSILPDVLEDTLKTGAVSVVDAPALVSSSSGPGMKIIPVLTLAGALLECLYLAVHISVRPTVLEGGTISRKLGIELLGEVPKGVIADYMYNQLLMAGVDEFPFQFRESMAYIAHLTAHKLEENFQNTVVVTSSFDREGKSTVAVNLAIELSKFRPRVLLADLDIHSPSLGKVFFDRPDHEHTVNAMQSNERSGEEAVLHLNSWLDLLPSGVTERPVKLAGGVMDQLKALFQQYDYVVIDASSVSSVSDVLPLQDLTDQVVYVIQQDNASEAVVRADIRDLQRVGFQILGGIVNSMNTEWPGYMKQYGYNLKEPASVELPENRKRELQKTILQRKALYQRNADRRDRRAKQEEGEEASSRRGGETDDNLL